VSVSSNGTEGNSLNGSWASLSADGSLVAFDSYASNLVANDTLGYRDVFIHNRLSGITERVSLTTSGAQANESSDSASLSADGRFVAFRSFAENLVGGNSNAHSDIFVRDRASGTTECVSVSTGGAQGNDGSWFPCISADARFVAFGSYASNLVAGDTNGFMDTFVHDRVSGTTERVSVDAAGTQGDAVSSIASLSADGRFVAFGSYASNLVPGDTNGAVDVFVRDRQLGTIERVSVDSNGAQANSSSHSWACISADGRYVAFSSAASNLVAGDTNGFLDGFVRDRANATTERVSVSSAGAQGNADSGVSSISADGRFVAIVSSASNFDPADTNLVMDIFVHDRLTGTTERVSVATGGAQANDASQVAFLIDGRFVAFSSFANNLVAGDTNGSGDIFVRDRGPQPKSYCTSATTSNGCYASIDANANPSISLANSCNITVVNVEGLKSGIVFYGIDNFGYTPASWAPGSTSLLCVKRPLQRTPIQNSGGTFGACDGSFVLDWNAYQSTHPLALGNPWSIDARVYVQAWFHDPLAVKSTNLSNALEMTYVP
jgi:Tol biopolymer transport system component